MSSAHFLIRFEGSLQPRLEVPVLCERSKPHEYVARRQYVSVRMHIDSNNVVNIKKGLKTVKPGFNLQK